MWKQRILPILIKNIWPILKKRDKIDCKNDGGISLLKVTYKMFSWLVKRRLIAVLEEKVYLY